MRRRQAGQKFAAIPCEKSIKPLHQVLSFDVVEGHSTMNRSFQAFAVLLVSLAGGMLAATWTSLPMQPRHQLFAVQSTELAGQLHCSCNPESLVRYEEGCARDKTTGEFYGCGLGLGKNGVAGKSLISRTSDLLVQGIVNAARLLHQSSCLHHGEFELGIHRLGAELAATLNQVGGELPQASAIERDYAAAELAAAESESNRQKANWLHVQDSVTALPSAFTTNSVRGYMQMTWQHLSWVNQGLERQTRLWLVEAGLHRQWDDLESHLAQESESVANIQPYFPQEEIDRWFQNFHPSVTTPDIFLNPGVKEERPDGSRQMILATAEMLESLSSMLHLTAENLARHAKQDVAELHTLKSDLEGRR
jgi:hypothetical protein